MVGRWMELGRDQNMRSLAGQPRQKWPTLPVNKLSKNVKKGFAEQLTIVIMQISQRYMFLGALAWARMPANGRGGIQLLTCPPASDF